LLLEPPGSQPTDPLPWAAYFHGGGWTFGTPEAFSPVARPWLSAGFRVMLPSYRRPPRVRIPQIVEDCHAAMAAVADFARRSGRPLSAPQLAGISAGGHLAAVLSLQSDRWARGGWPAPPGQALLCAAPLDLRLLQPRLLFRHYRSFNPAEMSVPPGMRYLLLHGTHDGMVDYRHSPTFLDHARRAGAEVELKTVPAGGHLDVGRWMFDDANPLLPLVGDFIRSAAPGPPGAG
jgi:acetyl esterase/lipase